MIQVKNLHLMHKKDLRPLLSDFSFALNPGDKAVIIGEEGNGKSTLLKWLVNPALVEDYVEAEGERITGGAKIGYLPQELPAKEKERTLYEFFCEEEQFFQWSPKELSKLAQELGLPVEFYYGEQQMYTLSGGEKVKAQMARILISEPDVFLLDEPSNDIDIEMLEWMERLIGETDRPVLYISHDETLIERTANVVIHLEQIRRKTVSRHTVARMPYREYLIQRENVMDNQMQMALNEWRQKRIRREKLNRIMQRVEHEQNTISRQNPHGGQLLKKKMKAVKSMERRFDKAAGQMTERPEEEEAILLRFSPDIRIPAGKTVLDFHLDTLTAGETESDLRLDTLAAGKTESAFHLAGQAEEKKGEGIECTPSRMLARNIHLFVRGPEKICIIGKNGAGKTTLLKHIAAELLARQDIRAAYMPQNYEELLNLDETPVDYLSESGDKEEITKIRTWLGSMKYTADEMSHPVRELSGGQKAKIFLLKMNLSGANVLILDEPTRNFSPLSNPVIRQVLSDFGGAIISISHDRKYIGEVCETVYELREDGLHRLQGDVFC